MYEQHGGRYSYHRKSIAVIPLEILRCFSSAILIRYACESFSGNTYFYIVTKAIEEIEEVYCVCSMFILFWYKDHASMGPIKRFLSSYLDNYHCLKEKILTLTEAQITLFLELS